MAIAEWVLKWRHVARKKTFETRLDIDKEAEIYQKQVIILDLFVHISCMGGSFQDYS